MVSTMVSLLVREADFDFNPPMAGLGTRTNLRYRPTAACALCQVQEEGGAGEFGGMSRLDLVLVVYWNSSSSFLMLNVPFFFATCSADLRFLSLFSVFGQFSVSLQTCRWVPRGSLLDLFALLGFLLFSLRPKLLTRLKWGIQVTKMAPPKPGCP